MASTPPPQNANQLQIVLVKPNLEHRWVFVYNVQPLQSFDPTAVVGEPEAVKEEAAAADHEEMAEEDVHDTTAAVVDQRAPVVAAAAASPKPAAAHTEEIDSASD